MPMLRGVPLLRVRGVPIEAHWSLPFALLYDALLFAYLLASYHPEGSSALIVALALASAFVFLVSTVLHELGHSLQARRRGGLPNRRRRAARHASRRHYVRGARLARRGHGARRRRRHRAGRAGRGGAVRPR